MTRIRGNLRISDLSSPSVLGVTVVVRFLWVLGNSNVKVMTDDNQRTMPRTEARKCWKRFRKAGYKATDDTLIAADGGFVSNKCSHIRVADFKRFIKDEKTEIELEAEMEGGAS